MKVLSPMSGFPMWGSGNRRRNPQRTWLWRPVGFDCRTSTGLGKTESTLGGHTQNLVHIRTQGKGAVTPPETEPNSLLELEGLCRMGGQLWFTMETRTLVAAVLRSTHWHEASMRSPLSTPACRLQCWADSDQTTKREGTQPYPSADKWGKV